MSFSVLPQTPVCLTKHLVLSIPTPKYLSQQSLLHPHGRAQFFIACPLLVSLTSSLAYGLHSSHTEIFSVPGNCSSLLLLKLFPLLSVVKVTSTFSLENSYVFFRNLSRCHFCGKSSQPHNQGTLLYSPRMLCASSSKKGSSAGPSDLLYMFIRGRSHLIVNFMRTETVLLPTHSRFSISIR